jgi:hypothetical protein
VLRKHQSRRTDFRTGRRLGRKDPLVVWSKPKQRPAWMDPQTYAALPPQVLLREVEMSVRQPGFRSQRMVILTTLLDPEAVSREDLGRLYLQRWQAELDVRSIKEALQMGRLRCQSPEMARKEIWVHLLAYQLIRGLMAQAAAGAGVAPRALSFTAAVQTLNAFGECLRTVGAKGLAALHGRLLEALARHRVGSRPGRTEPRATKQRKRKYPVLTQPRQHARKRLLKAA